MRKERSYLRNRAVDDQVILAAQSVSAQEARQAFAAAGF